MVHLILQQELKNNVEITVIKNASMSKNMIVLDKKMVKMKNDF